MREVDVKMEDNASPWACFGDGFIMFLRSLPGWRTMREREEEREKERRKKDRQTENNN